FDVVAARGPALLSPLRAHLIVGESESGAAAATEELLEEIAEARAVEVKLEVLGARWSTPATGLLTRRRTETGSGLPVGAQFIVTLALLRIAQDLISFVDLFELRLGGLFLFGDVGVILASEFTESLLDGILAGIAWHAESRVVIFEFNGHGGLDHSPPAWL